MSIRFLIVLVAFSAVATELTLAAWRAVTYNKRAADHARHLNSARFWLYESEDRRQWHERMRRKYEQAVSHPWLPVAPDPPEPQ